MANDKSVFGLYSKKSDVEQAISKLHDAGFFSSDVSVLLPENLGSGEVSREVVTEKSTKAPEGAAAGAGTGALVGGAVGWMTGLGALVIPGIGPFIAAGPLLTALVGAGVGGALGGFTGALIGVGIPEYEAKRYAAMLVNGNILVAVHCSTAQEVERAKTVMEATGAKDIASSGEADRTRHAA